MRLNRRWLPARRSALHSLTLALLGLAAVATSAEAGSAKATFSVSATVIANCATRNQTVVCTKGVASPTTVTVTSRTSGGRPAAPVQGHPSTPPSDQPQAETLVTVNF
jgi:hypothetical protein